MKSFVLKNGLIFLFCSLSSYITTAQKSASIHCTFASDNPDTCVMIPQQYFIEEYEKPNRGIISNQSCDISLPVTKPTTVEFIYRHQSVLLFIEPGDVMELNVGTDSLRDAISFSGSNEIQNRFLISFYKTFFNDFDKASISKDILSMDADAFEIKLYEERKKQLDFYKSWPNTDSFSEPFKKYVENTIRYNYFARLLSYPIVQANQSAQILTVKALPPVMLEGVDSKLVNDEALNCETYRDFLFYYVVYFTSVANGYNKFKDLSTSMESKIVTANKNFSGKSLNWYIASFLNSDVGKVSQYTAGHIYRELSLAENNGVYTQLLKNKVEKRLAIKDADDGKKSAGANTPPLTSATKNNFPRLKDMDGNYFTFDDLKGKVVYVDYWASWCGPCRMQMQYSKQLHEMFNDKQLKQLVFLYISIDQSEDDWKNAVNQIGMEGKIAISPGNWQSEIATYFQINSIPRYMLIDKKGNIVDLNAKRPSTGTDIYNDILKLLE